MSTTPSHTPVAVPSPSAAASRPTPPAPAQDPPLTDISGNVYEKITTFPHPLFVSPSAGKTYFLGTEQFAPGVDSLVRCTLLDHEALDARFYTKGTEQSVGIPSMGLKVDQASFQLTKTNEDRTFALEFEHGLLCGVFDGHVGHQLSSHAVENFPCLLATALSATLAQHPASSASLSSALTSTIVGTFKAYDKEVEIVIIGRTVNGAWTTIPLNDEHNGKNPVEAARIRAEHPGKEETVVAKDRVCGGIAVTRAFGDFTFKFAPDFTYNVLRYATPPFTRWANVEACLADSFTPPYLSAVASVYHENILPGDVLLLASDGLGDCPRVDALSAEEKAAAFTALAREGAGGEAVTSTLNGIGQKVGHGLRLEAGGENAATRVLKNTLWGDDAVKGSFELTAEVPEGEALQDDISVVIVQF